MNLTWKCCISLVGVLSLIAVGQAGTMTFSDLDPGLPFNQQFEMPVNYSTGLPAGITATWAGFSAKNAAGPDDHTPDNDDQMQAFGSESTGSIAFSSPLYVAEVWANKTSWGDTGDWIIKGNLAGVEQWTQTITTPDIWTSITAGAGIAVDELVVPQQGLWNHIDDLTFAPVPEPSTLGLLAGGMLALLIWRRK